MNTKLPSDLKVGDEYLDASTKAWERLSDDPLLDFMDHGYVVVAVSTGGGRLRKLDSRVKVQVR